LYTVAEPLSELFCNDIDTKEISARDDPKELYKKLAEKYSWDINDAKKIWCFGPDETGPNVLVDQTKAIQYVNEIKDSMQSAFQWATREGAMT
jgi:elongation factor 2